MKRFLLAILLVVLIVRPSYSLDIGYDVVIGGASPFINDYSQTLKIADTITKGPWIDIRSELPNNAVTDATVDYTTGVTAAVAAAYAAGKELYWPHVYLTTASIPNFHGVKHRGPGGVKRGSDIFYVQAKTGQTNTLYCDDDAANDLGDGLSASQPIQQIRTAAEYLGNYGPMLEGSWIIRAAAGTYGGGIAIPRNLQSRDFIKVLGPDVGGHPNTPTAIISKTTDTSRTYGIFASDGAALWTADLKIAGAFAQGEYVSRNVYYQRHNVHVDGAATGLQVNNHSRYFSYGGIIENCTTAGVNELFHVIRSYASTDATTGTIIRNNSIGLKAKESCVGHSDYATFDGNATGLELQAWSTTNPKGAVFKNNEIAIVLVNSEVHNESAIVWGTGADANTRRFLSIGNSSEIDGFDWEANNGNPSLRNGHRPLVTRYSKYNVITHTGTTDETTLGSDLTLTADMYAIQGKKLKVQIKGAVPIGTTLTADARLLLRMSNTFMTDVTIPSGTVGNASFIAEFEVVCTADGTFQFASSSLLVDGKPAAVTGIARTVNLSDADHTALVSAILGNSADALKIYSIEIWG